MGNQGSQIFEWSQHFIVLQRNFNDSTLVLQRINGQEEYLGRQLLCSDKSQSLEIKRLIRHKYENINPYLTRLLETHYNSNANYCSGEGRIYLLFQKPRQTLRQEILARKFAGEHFTEEEADIILETGVKAIRSLREMQQPHKNISTSSIFVEEDRRIVVGDPWITPPAYSQDMSQNVYACPSPQKILFQNDQILSICPYRADLFSLGTVVLEALNFEHMDILYEKGFRRVLENKIKEKLALIKDQELRYKLSIVLSHDPLNRDEIYNLYRGKAASLNDRRKLNKSSAIAQISQGVHKTTGIKHNAPIKIEQNYSNYPVSGVGKAAQPFMVSAAQTKKQNPVPRGLVYTPIRHLTSPINLASRNQPVKFTNNPPAYSGPLTVVPPQNQPIRYGLPTHFPPIQAPPSSLNVKYEQQGYVPPGFTQQGRKHSEPVKQVPPIERGRNQLPLESVQQASVGSVSKPLVESKLITEKPIAPALQKNSHNVGESTISNFEPVLTKSADEFVKTSSDLKYKQPQQNPHALEKPQVWHHGTTYGIKTPSQSHIRPPITQSFDINNYEVSESNINRKTISESSDYILIDSINQPQPQPQPQSIPSSMPAHRNTPEKRPTRKYNSTIKEDPDENECSGSVDGEDIYQYVVEEYDGGRYEGQKRHGMRNGYGKFIYNEGSVYEGEWKDNFMHGKGNLYYANGALAYEGEWRKDEFHGFGRVYNQDQLPLRGSYDYTDFSRASDYWSTYEGQLNADRRHGRGKIKLSNDEIFSGIFVSDLVEGEGKFYTLKGEIVHGIWKNNMLVKRL